MTKEGLTQEQRPVSPPVSDGHATLIEFEQHADAVPCLRRALHSLLDSC